MAESADDPTLFWVDPEERGVFPLEKLIVSKSLAKVVRSDRYEIRIDSDFDGVMDGCAGGDASRPSTWINERIRKLYYDLFRQGHVHTVEAWRDGELVGGLYGLAIGSASSARACSTARATPRRSVSCISSRGCAQAASRFSTRNS